MLDPAALPLVEALGRALLHSLWQGALVALLLWFALAYARADRATLRYGLACGALFMVPLLFGATALWAHDPGPMPAAVTAGGSQVAATPEVSVTEGAARWLESVGWGLEPLLPWLVALWLAGVLTFALRFAGNFGYLLRLRRRTQPPDASWQQRLDALAESLRLHRSVRLLESSLVEVPTALGWLRPVILVPASAFAGLTPQQLESVLAHELAHIRRHDYLVNLLQTAVETLHFYHPAVWWLSAQLRREREHCCDDLAVATCGDPLIYARALAALETVRGPEPRLALAATGGTLMQRIHRLLGLAEPKSSGGRNRLATAPAALSLLLLSGLVLAACSMGGSSERAFALPQTSPVCLSAEVTTGDYLMPAFNEASIRAMGQAAAKESLEVAASCAADSVSLQYRMAFDAQSLSWQADLTALDPSGTALWRGTEAGAIPPRGAFAFQQATESTAKTLLTRFSQASDR